MSDPAVQEHNGSLNGSDGAAASASNRRKIASALVDGTIGSLTFHQSGHTLAQDALKLPEPMRNALAAFGLVAALQTAYSGAGKTPEQAEEDARDCLERIKRGEWTPGRPKAEREIEPIVEAIAERMKLSVEQVEDEWLPRYCKKHGYVRKDGKSNIASAKRELMSHHELAPLVGKILAQRAKDMQAAGKAGKAAKEAAPSLDV